MIKKLLILGLVFIILDFIYLFLMRKKFKLMVQNVQNYPLMLKPLPTIACYILLILSIYHFIISKKGSYLDAFLLGLVIYGVFETTNYAILKNWSWKAVVMDTIWGGILFYLTTYIVYSFNK